MGSGSRWIIIGCLVFLALGGPCRIVASLNDIGLYPSATNEQVVSELKRQPGVQAARCRPAKPEWDFVCDVDVQVGRDPLLHRRYGIRASLSHAVAVSVPLPLDGPILTERQARQWAAEEREKLAAPVNIRTATIEELQRIPRVDRYRAQEIHAAVQYGLVRKFDDLLKIQGIDQRTLEAMRTRAYWK
jgi:Helix-hairpin-helix motif